MLTANFGMTTYTFWWCNKVCLKSSESLSVHPITVKQEDEVNTVNFGEFQILFGGFLEEKKIGFLSYPIISPHESVHIYQYIVN